MQINTEKLKKLIYAICCSPESEEKFQVQFFEPDVTGEYSCLHLIVYQSSGDFQKHIVFEHGIDRINVNNHSKAKDFNELVAQAEHRLEKLLKQKLLILQEFESYEDKIYNFYNDYTLAYSFLLDQDQETDYFNRLAKTKVSNHFAEWFTEENKGFLSYVRKNQGNLPTPKDFFLMYQRYCTFEGRE